MTTVRAFFALVAIAQALGTLVCTAIFAKATYESFREDDWHTGGIGLLYTLLSAGICAVAAAGAYILITI